MNVKKLLLLSSSFFLLTIQSLDAKDNSWNSDLSKMMDGIEKNLDPSKGPPGPPPPVMEPPPPEKPPAEVKPKKKISGTKSSITKESVLNDLFSMKDNYLGAFASHGLTRWQESSMPLKIFIEQNSLAKGYRQEFSKLLQEAFLTWANSSDGLVKVTFTSNQKEAQIICRFTDNKADLMSLHEGGNTVIVPDEDGILTADMKILTLPPPNSSTVETNYMRRVCLHEVGHALGLTGHSPTRADIMFSTVYANDPSTLTETDKNSLTELYKLDNASISMLKLDQEKAMGEIPTKYDNPQVNAVRLNNEAAKLIKSNQYDKAISKLLLAHKLDPNNRAVSANLGAIYANYGSLAGMTFNLKGAKNYYKKAIPLLESGSNKLALKQVLTNYLKVLQLLNQPAEAKAIQSKLAKLSN